MIAWNMNNCMAKCMENRIDIIDYMVGLVHEFAKSNELTDYQSFGYMWRYGAVQDIIDNYAAAHTLTYDDVCQTISKICKSRGGKI